MTGAHTSKPDLAAKPWLDLEAIVSSSALRSGTAADAIGGLIPARVVTPASERELSSVLQWANNADVRVALRGGGTKQHFGNRPDGLHLVVSTARLSSIVEHAHEDMTATAQAGITIAALQHELSKRNQRLAIDVLWPDSATVGGIIATNDSGTLRLRFGSIRDLLIGATIALADGTIARSGGKVVKNVAGYDLPKLLTGSFGTLGAITEATFRVHPLPHATESLTFDFPDPAAANRLILDIAGSALVPAGVQLRCGSSGAAKIDVCFEGLPAGIAAQIATLSRLTSGPSHPSPAGVWNSREELWSTEANLICKFSVLPSELGELCSTLSRRFSDPRIVAQGTGLGFFSADASLDSLAESIRALRSAMLPTGGSLVVLRCPVEWKSALDVFGEPADSLPLMLRVKQRFDPKGILNRGRFIGGI